MGITRDARASRGVVSTTASSIRLIENLLAMPPDVATELLLADPEEVWLEVLNAVIHRAYSHIRLAVLSNLYALTARGP